jgi:hypothetical protein
LASAVVVVGVLIAKHCGDPCERLLGTSLDTESGVFGRVVGLGMWHFWKEYQVAHVVARRVKVAAHERIAQKAESLEKTPPRFPRPQRRARTQALVSHIVSS